MRRIITILAAALMAAGITLFAPAPPAAAVTDTTYHVVPHSHPQQLAIRTTAHNVAGTNQVVVDKIELFCTTGCGVAGTYRFRDVYLDLRGPSGGATGWAKSGIDVPSGGQITFWPNIQMHQNGYWYSSGTVQPGPYVYRDCWKVWPAGTNPAHAGCAWLARHAAK